VVLLGIAFFVWEFYPELVGGLGTYAIEITRKFIELCHDVSVFSIFEDGHYRVDRIAYRALIFQDTPSKEIIQMVG
jgi:hypothetical protein